MMRLFTPNSWGSAVKEYNPCHEPAGTSKGGQFARKPCAGEGEDLPNTPGGQGVDEPEPRILRDPPQPKLKAGKSGEDEEGGVTSIDDYSDADVVEALGLGDVQRLAENMVSEITTESFQIKIESTASNKPAGPDPDDVRDEYDEYVEERSREIAKEAHYEAERDYERSIGRALPRLADMYDQLKEEYADRITFLDKTAEGYTDAYDRLLSYSTDYLIGERGSNNEEGGLRYGGAPVAQSSRDYDAGDVRGSD